MKWIVAVWVVVLMVVGATVLMHRPAQAASGGRMAAADQPVICNDYLDDVFEMWTNSGNPIAMVPADKLAAFLEELAEVTGIPYEGVTRAFTAQGGLGYLVGLEIDGCLLAPIVLAAPLATAGMPLVYRPGFAA